MAFNYTPEFIGLFKAGEAIERGQLVVLNQFGKWQIAKNTGTLADIIHGVSATDIVSGEIAKIQYHGIAPVQFGETILAGRQVGVDGQGRVVQSATGSAGWAVEEGVEGQLMGVLINAQG